MDMLKFRLRILRIGVLYVFIPIAIFCVSIQNHTKAYSLGYAVVITLVVFMIDCWYPKLLMKFVSKSNESHDSDESLA